MCDIVFCIKGTTEKKGEKAMAGYAQDRSALVALSFFVTVLLLCIKQSDGTEYVVGDEFGWSYNIDLEGWASGKTFRAGDVLVFNYVPTDHDVVEVNKDAYDSCKSKPSKMVYKSGHDQVTLTKGTKYYICSYHCDYANQKITINVN